MVLYFGVLKSVLEGYEGLLKSLDRFVVMELGERSGLEFEFARVEECLELVQRLLKGGVENVEIPKG